jgi:hypothetical protein
MAKSFKRRRLEANPPSLRFVFVVFLDGDLVAVIEPAAKVDQFAPLAAERIRRFRSIALGFIDRLFADGAEHLIPF